MEWEEVDPGRKKREIRPQETARRGSGARHFCHLAIAGARARPRPGPARRGESPAAAAPPHALPRRPRARGRPGQVAAVPGSGRPGAAASERGGGGAAPDRPPARSGSRRACGARCLGPASPERIQSPPLSPVRACFTFRLSREGAAPAGGWRARLAAGSLPSRHLRPPRPALARGRREPAAGTRRGRRGRARVCGAREGRRKEGRAQRPAAGAGVRPAGRGGGAPPVRS